MIPEDNLPYLFFNSLVSVLCIISSYYYLYIASFRYDSKFESESAGFTTMIIFESVFFVHMMLQFILEYRIEDKNETIKNIIDIALNYLYTGFIFDLIPLLPF